MASYPPPYTPPPGYDPRDQRRIYRDQVRSNLRAQKDAMRAQRDALRYQNRTLRRGSSLGPLLLIAAGIVFLLLQTGRLSHQRFLDWYAGHWPLLFIGAGILLLLEWAFDEFYLRKPDRPQFRRSIGGGVFTLLLLAALTGMVTQNWHLHGDQSGNWLLNGMHFGPDDLDEFIGDKHESDQSLEVALPANGSFTLANPRGDITLNGTSDDNRIHIAVHKQVYTRTDSEADSRAQQLQPAVVVSGSAVSVTMPTVEGTRADLVVTLPAAATTFVTANRGDLHVAGIKAPVAATANHGDIDLSAITGPATAHINSGGASISAHSMGSGITIEGHAQDITLSDIAGPVAISGEFFGSTHIEHVTGTVHFHTSRTDLQLARLDGQVEISPDSDLSADRALGPVILTTHNRNISLDRIAGDVTVTNRNGSIDLTAAPLTSGALGNLSLEDRNGNIKTILPEHAGFIVQASTTNGQINTDYPFTAQGSDNRRSLNGTAGSGGSLLHISTTNGDIAVNKGTVAPLPTAPPAPPKVTLTPPPAPAAPRAPRTPAPAAQP